MKKRLFYLLAAILLSASGILKAQDDVAIKTNLLSDVALSPNLAIEIGLAPKWSLNMAGQVNFWEVKQHLWKHWLFQPEIRYWFCDRFAGNFVGLHAIGGQYNFGNIKNGIKFLGSDFSQLSHYRYQGWGVGAGIAYGHAWILSKHWNLEFEVGVGWIYTRYDKFLCNNCGKQLENNHPHNYVGPTKLDLSLEYIF